MLLLLLKKVGSARLRESDFVGIFIADAYSYKRIYVINSNYIYIYILLIYCCMDVMCNFSYYMYSWMYDVTQPNRCLTLVPVSTDTTQGYEASTGLTAETGSSPQFILIIYIYIYITTQRILLILLIYCYIHLICNFSYYMYSWMYDVTKPNRCLTLVPVSTDTTQGYEASAGLTAETGRHTRVSCII